MIRILASLTLLFALALPALAGKRVALVIGNSDYKFVPALTNPVNDAALMELALKNVGFEVIRRDNLDQQGMKLAMIEFSRTLKQGADAGMFYYAGHGIEVDGKNYLVPVDSNMQSKEEADVYNFDVNSFMAMMENSGVPFNIMVLDACRNNPFRGFRATGGGLAPMRAPVGSYVAYATAPGSVAADGDGKNSPFTEALAASMTVPGLPLEEVFKQTRAKVRAATNGAQVPYDSSAIEGSFYFSGQPGSVTTPVVDDTAIAKQAFDAAGQDTNLLRTVAREFPNTIWGKMAASRADSLETQTALLQKPDNGTQPSSPLRALPLPKAGFTQWMEPPAYQKLFDTNIKKKLYPREVECTYVDFQYWIRGRYEKYPSRKFGFSSYTGMTKKIFDERRQKFGKDGYRLSWQHSYNNGEQDLYCATWTVE